jgi:hypothetical protein
MLLIKHLIFSLFILLLHLQPHSVFCQDDESSSLGQRFVSDANDAVNSSVHVFSRPYSWRASDWLNFGYVMAGAAALSLADNEVRRIFQRNQSKTADSFARVGEIYGEPLTAVAITAGIYLFGNIMDDQWARETAIIMTATLLPAGIYQTAAKITAGRARPYLELGPHYFNTFTMQEDYHSFVSGHTLVAMGTSLVLARQINNNLVSGALISVGVLAGLTRVYTDDHWFSDVVLGSALALASSKSAEAWLSDKHNISNLKLKWLVTPAHNGLHLTFLW